MTRCTECSRLASRVEELERGLRNALRQHIYWPEGKVCADCMHVGCIYKRKAESLLAGAHAEEKR